MKGLSKARRALAVAIIAVFAATMLAIVGCACSSTAVSSSGSSSSASMSANDPMTVPNVVSLTQADADKALAAAGFSIGSITRQASDTVPKDHVISQDPAAFSSAPAGSKVNLVISSGKAEPKDVNVPDLKGKTQGDAEKALTEAGLVGVASNPEVSTEVAPGQVFKQSVAAGTTVKEGTRVAFTVATAPDQVKVPDVAGMKSDDAKAAITNAKLGFDYTVAYNDSVPEGNVISQSIPAGTMVASGTTVSVQVSLGPTPQKDVQVPNVMTFSWSDAEHALMSAGLQARYTGDPAGVVVNQDVAAGTMVAPGTLVTVTLAKDVEEVTVPDLVGMSVTTAEDTVSKLGLTLDIESGGFHGTVASQSPEAGTKVATRSTVRVVVDDSAFKMPAQGSDSAAASSPAAESASAPAVAPDPSSFVGSWAADRASLKVGSPDGNGVLSVSISWADSADKTTTWEYKCKLADGKLVANGTGVKSTTEGGNTTQAYTDGSATFSLDGSGKLVWKDQKEDAGKGLTFSHS